MQERNTAMREKDKTPQPPTKRPWKRPALRPAGTVGDLLQGGGGKLSPSPKDSGEERKVPGTDG
jgi:hypothetical protein